MEGRWYTVAEIAEMRGVSQRAVYKQIKTHEKKLEEHTRKEAGKNWYDEEAVKILQDASTQSPVVHVENAEKEEVERLKRELAEARAELEADRKSMRAAQDLISTLMTQASEQARIAAEASVYLEDKQRLMEEKKELEEANMKLQETTKTMEIDLAVQKALTDDKSSQIENLQAENTAQREKIETLQADAVKDTGQIATLQEQAKTMGDELNRIKSRSLWERILNK